MLQLYNATVIIVMQIKLDFRSGVPIYVQIIDQVKHLIASGELRAGDQLPTVRHLAQELRVNFNTIARAYRLLDEAGVISTQHGRGTYVLEPDSEEGLKRVRREALEELTRQYITEAIHLGYTPLEVKELFERYLYEYQDSLDGGESQVK